MKASDPATVFGPPNFVMHMLTVSILAASIALVLTLIILLENPFRERNHISVVPFERLVKTVEEMAYPQGLLPSIIANGTTAFLVILAMTFGLILPRMLLERFLPAPATPRRWMRVEDFRP
jgi:hypothetical protein